ncbi:MAG TPA: GYF domain-containing protein [Polyangiaceae bacterium]|nr:GYF domain-containing protein [Polyangiaceae bacterium]
MTNADEDTARSQDELPPPDESTLWLVSFGEEDDREMRAPEIAQSLRRGEIRADTIVWREGLPEWVPLSTIAMLARLLVTSGETRAAPAAVLGKVPLAQREERAKPNPAPVPAPAAATPVAVPNPSTTATPGPTSAVATFAGVGRQKLPSISDDRPTDNTATPAWKGRTRIGLPKVETAPHVPHSPEASQKAPLVSATGTPLPTGAQLATGTPLPVTAMAATPPTTGEVTPKGATPTTAKAAVTPATPASKGTFGTLEPKRPEARAIEPKPGAKPAGTPKPGAIAPRTSVPRAAPVPGTKPVEATPATNVAPSSPIAADKPIAVVATPPATLEPELPTLPDTTFDAPEPETTRTGSVSPKPAASPEPPKAAASPEPPRAAVAPEPPARKEPPKGPPPRHREPAPPGARPPSPKPDARPPKTGAAYIWEDAESVNVDPESVRPPPPVHAIAEARAAAPGLKKKIAPKPPSPPSPPKRAPSIPVETDEPTIPIPMAAPIDDLIQVPVETSTEAMPFAPIALPSIEEFGKTPEPLLDTTPTVPRETRSDRAAKPVAAPKPERPAATPPAPKPAVATVSTPPAQEKRRSLFPFVLLGAAAAAVALTFALKKQQPPPEPVATAEPVQTAAPTETAKPEVTPVPEATATAAATAEATATPSAAPETTAAPAQTAATTAPATPTPPAATTSKPATTTVATSAPKEPKPEPVAKPEPTPKPETSKPVAAAPAQTQVSDVGGDFDRSAASAALTSAAGVASGCRKSGDPTGVAVVHVTFANSGRATRALVEGPPFAGTATGGCIAEALRNTKVPPYGGDRVTVTKRVVIQ